MTPEEKKQIRDKFDKMYGKGSIQTYDENYEHQDLERFSTGSLDLDRKIGGGYPKGRIVEIFGPESSGKSTLCYHAIAEHQQKYEDSFVVLIDSEQTQDPKYMESIGVSIPDLINSQESIAENVYNMIFELLNPRSKTLKPGLIIMDSWAALQSQASYDAEIGKSTMGVDGKLAADFYKKITPLLNQFDCTLMIINQMRSNFALFQANEKPTGGNALKFYASIRLHITGTKRDEKDGEAVAKITNVKSVKNKTYPPHRTATFKIRYEVGIDKVSEIIDLAVEKNVVKKSGSWFEIQGLKLQGMDSVREYYLNNKDKLEELKLKSLE